jgi:hypothetical protein
VLGDGRSAEVYRRGFTHEHLGITEQIFLKDFQDSLASSRFYWWSKRNCLRCLAIVERHEE